METLIGFAVGYYVGTREGKAGLRKAMESLEAIRDSDEVRQLAGMIAPTLKKIAGGGAGAMVSGVLEELNRRALAVQGRAA